MKRETARSALAAAAAGPPPGLGNFVLRGKAISDATITRFDLESDLAAAVEDDVVQALRSIVVKQFVDYDPSYQTNSSQILVEELDQVPELAQVDRRVRLGDVPDDDGSGEGVVAMVHAVGAGDRQMVAYRLKGPGVATRRPRGIPLLPRDGVYRRIQEEVLYYEPRFDAFTFGGFVYFRTATLIQTKLLADEKARQLAKATLTRVTSAVEIDGYEALEEAVMKDPSLRAKMSHVARIMATDPDYARHLTTERLVAFVQDHPHYGIKTTTTGSGDALVFDPAPQHRHQIPRLLADDYLHSQLTDRDYEAGSKQRV